VNKKLNGIWRRAAVINKLSSWYLSREFAESKENCSQWQASPSTCDRNIPNTKGNCYQIHREIPFQDYVQEFRYTGAQAIRLYTTC